MLTNYFTRSATHSTYYAGLAGPYLDDFTGWLAQRGFGSDAIRHLLVGASGFANWIQVTGNRLTLLPVGVWDTFCKHLSRQGRLHRTNGQHTIYWRGAQHFVEYLRDQHGISTDRTPAETAPPELVAMFEHWMQVHRGVQPSTLTTYRRHVIDLLSTLGEDPGQFNAAMLHAFILAYAKHSGRAVARTRVKANDCCRSGNKRVSTCGHGWRYVARHRHKSCLSMPMPASDAVGFRVHSRQARQGGGRTLPNAGAKKDLAAQPAPQRSNDGVAGHW